MTRTKLDTQIDSLINDTATVTGLDPNNSMQTKEMRDNKIPAGDRDDLHTALSAALKRNRIRILTDAARMHDPDITEEQVTEKLREAAEKAAQAS